MKYIVKNCEIYWKNKGICGASYHRGGFKDETETYSYCKDICLCLHKTIYEHLSKVIESQQCNSCDGCGYENNCGDESCGYYQARKCIELLDIEEVE